MTDRKLRGSDFAEAGDEWLITFLLSPYHLSRVGRFAAGFAAECYLKAVIARCWPNPDLANKQAQKHKHDLAKLIGECRKLIPDFLPALRVSEKLLSRDPWRQNDVLGLSDEEVHEFSRYREFYIACKYLKDIKYMAGVPAIGVYSRGMFTDIKLYPDVFWMRFLGEVRIYARGGDGGEGWAISLTRRDTPENSSLIRMLDDVLQLRCPPLS